MHAAHALLDRIDAVLEFRQHAAAGISLRDEIPGFTHGDLGDQRRRIQRISVNALDIRQEDQLLRFYRLCNGAGRIVRIDVIGMKISAKTDRTDDRNKVILNQSVNKPRVNFCNLADIAEIHPRFQLFLIGPHCPAVLSGYAAGPDSVLFHVRHKAFVYPSEHHLSDLHGLFVGHPEAVDEFRRLTGKFDPTADFLASPVNNNRFHADQLEQRDIRYHTLLQR